MGALHKPCTGRAPGVHGLAAACLAITSALLTFPALAQGGVYTPPAGCEGWLTVQTRSCKVSNYFRCDSDPAGGTWRTDFGINGAYFRSRIDDETQWVESHESDGTIDLLEPGAPDPASFSELLETGEDSYHFSTVKNTGLRETFVGADRLTGESRTIDGVTLLRTEYEIRATLDDGSVVWRAEGSEYVHPEWRVFFSGVGRMDLGEGWLPRDFTPVEFVFPGEPGFMTTTPKYDCDALTASLDLFPLKEARHDQVR